MDWRKRAGVWGTAEAQQSEANDDEEDIEDGDDDHHRRWADDDDEDDGLMHEWKDDEKHGFGKEVYLLWGRTIHKQKICNIT